MKKFFRPPPETEMDVFALIDLIWDQGIGNTALPGGGCGAPWTYETLIDAFEDVGGALSKTTIDNWRRKDFVPQQKNLYFLARAISDRQTFDAWRDALFRAARRTRDTRKLWPQSEAAGATLTPGLSTEQEAADRPERPAWREAQAETTSSLAAATELSGHSDTASGIRFSSGLIGAALAGVVLVAGFWSMLNAPAQEAIANLRVCDSVNFSVANQSCSRSVQAFPADTKRVYVSFDILNFPDNVPFRRTWFLNGQKLMEKEGLLAPPWNGWTWFGSAEPDLPDAAFVESGNYTFRVEAGDAVETVFFQVGAVRPLRPGQLLRDPFVDGSGEGPELVVLPAGHFVKGSPENESGRRFDEGVRHSVLINYQMAVSPREVSWDDWMACVDDGGCNGYVPDGRDAAPGNFPVVNVSYNDIFAYTHWLNRRLGIAQERFDRYTLLSESEWEFAALAGTQGSALAPYAFGPDLTPDEASYSTALSRGQIKASGSYPPNPWGLFDMHGNVAERVEDCYRPFHDKTLNDGSAYLDAACPSRVVKGGSFLDDAAELRAAARRPVKPEDRRPDVGFRLVRRIEQRANSMAEPE